MQGMDKNGSVLCKLYSCHFRLKCQIDVELGAVYTWKTTKRERRDAMKGREDSCLLCGSLINGKYRIIREIGHGGMSRVYLVVNEAVNRKWAMKELRQDHQDVAAMQGLLREINMMKKLKHPGLPEIIDVIEESGRFFLVMEFVEGDLLSERLEKEGAQPLERVLLWGIQLCEVLEYLHAQSPPVVYRDMKPANIIEKQDGRLALIDFGTAREYSGKKYTDTVCLGTVGYAAPEQFGGNGETDVRTDIYCLGATLYHLLTGEHPGKGIRAGQRGRRSGRKKSSRMEQIIWKCTRKDPKKRYQSCAELCADLRQLQQKQQKVQHKRGKQAERQWRGYLRKGVAIILAVVAVMYMLSERNNERYRLEQDDTDRYTQELLQTDTYDGYYSLILQSPGRTEAYEALTEFLINDLILTREEGQKLNRLWTGISEETAGKKGKPRMVMEELKEQNRNGYIKVCYEIGMCFLQFSEVNVERDRYQNAKRWLREVENEILAAKSYCQIADCLDLLRKYQESHIIQPEKVYDVSEQLWMNVRKLRQNALELKDMDDRFQVWAELVRLLNTDTEVFLKVASSDDLLLFLQNLSSDVEQIHQKELEGSVQELCQAVEELTEKIESVQE